MMSWIKVHHATPNKPEIGLLSRKLKISRARAFGACVWIWIWADQNADGDFVVSGSKEDLDDLVSVPGVADALVEAGWLEIADGKICFRNIDRHLSGTAKNNALAAKRQEKWRNGQPSLDKTRQDNITSSSLFNDESHLVKEEGKEERRNERKGKEGGMQGGKPEFPAELDTDEIKGLWIGWMESRSATWPKRPFSDRSAQIAITKLLRWGYEKAKLALENAAIGGWLGLHEPDEPPAKSGMKAMDANRTLIGRVGQIPDGDPILASMKRAIKPNPVDPSTGLLSKAFKNAFTERLEARMGQGPIPNENRLGVKLDQQEGEAE
jgi:hypothetical protein